MKKKIAIMLAAVMTISSLPITAFASTTNTVSKVPTIESDKEFESSVILDDFKGIISSSGDKQTIKLTLTNAEYRKAQFEGTDKRDLTLDDLKDVKYYKFNVNKYDAVEKDGSPDFTVGTYDGKKYVYYTTDRKFYQSDLDISKETEAANTVKGKLGAELADKTLAIVPVEATRDGVKYTKISDTTLMAEFTAKSDSKINLSIIAKSKGSGDATLTIESVDSVVSSQTLKIANIASGSTTTKVSGTTAITETGANIKSVVITETTAGTVESGTLKLRLSNGFKFSDKTPDIVVFPEKGNGDLVVKFDKFDNDKQDALFTVTGKSKTASTISIGDLKVSYDSKDVKVGSDCKLTISGAGTNKESIDIGSAADYGISFTAKDKTLPTFYAGDYDSDKDTLEVTIKENIAKSWLENRKTKLVFPEGVEPVSVELGTTKNCTISESNFKFDDNEITISDVTRKGSDTDKIEINAKFTLSVSPKFTGDITATLSGSAVGDDIKATVGTAKAPVSVKADRNELKIDYRNTKANDIVITEAEAGVLKKGTTATLAVDGINFDGTPSVKVSGGDMKIENVKVKNNRITFDIKTESQKEPAVITISDINLFMERSLPAGKYDLMFVSTDKATNSGTFKPSNDAIIRNYGSDTKQQGIFDIDELVVSKGYVEIVTAGRDQDDSTFTTKVTVTIGSDTMYAGTTAIKLDVPAYISNGYTMMPVRAVTEALSGSAIVRWDDATKTVTITFGQRVISMTVGSKTMKINGVDVAMQAQCEITGERAFIPLRDLGYALGLNDSKIKWDDAKKTATLN